jgi:hypothetical protein
MKANLKTRWIIICLIWACPLILTHWNINKIAVTMAEIEKENIFHLDDLFWKNNSENISKVLAKRDSLALPIESINFGLLSVENSLKALASKHKFNEVRLESVPGQTSDSSTPLTLYFEGPFQEILPWLKTLQNELPYLMIRHVKITTDPFSKRSKFQLQFYFRYIINDSANPT